MTPRLPAPASNTDWVRRARGSPPWAACGDALGLPFEGARLVDAGDIDELMA